MARICADERAKLPFALTICGLDELASSIRGARPTHVVSISDPGDYEIEFPERTQVLRLAFYDVHAVGGLVSALMVGRGDGNLPCMCHAKAIQDFGRKFTDKARVLVHCHAGVSRSTAAAFLLLCQQMPGAEQSAFQVLKALRPQARPNRLLVKFADRLLGAGGRMLGCL